MEPNTTKDQSAAMHLYQAHSASRYAVYSQSTLCTNIPYWVNLTNLHSGIGQQHCASLISADYVSALSPLSRPPPPLNWEFMPRHDTQHMRQTLPALSNGESSSPIAHRYLQCSIIFSVSRICNPDCFISLQSPHIPPTTPSVSMRIQPLTS